MLSYSMSVKETSTKNGSSSAAKNKNKRRFSSNSSNSKRFQQRRGGHRLTSSSLDDSQQQQQQSYHSSVTLFQEESEFQLFDRRRSTTTMTRGGSGSRDRSQERQERRRKMKRLLLGATPLKTASEPDLSASMPRYSARCIGAGQDVNCMSNQEYRRRRQLLYLSGGLFYRSADQIHQLIKDDPVGAVASAKATILAHQQQQQQQQQHMSSSTCRTRTPITVPTDSLLPPDICYFPAASSSPSPSSSSANYRLSSSSVSFAASASARSTVRSSYSTVSASTRSVGRGQHDDCCECSYRPLSETVTLARSPASGQWRACMVSGRQSISNHSANSP